MERLGRGLRGGSCGTGKENFQSVLLVLTSILIMLADLQADITGNSSGFFPLLSFCPLFPLSPFLPFPPLPFFFFAL